MEVTSSKYEVQESAQHTTWTSAQKQKNVDVILFLCYCYTKTICSTSECLFYTKLGVLVAS